MLKVKVIPFKKTRSNIVYIILYKQSHWLDWLTPWSVVKKTGLSGRGEPMWVYREYKIFDNAVNYAKRMSTLEEFEKLMQPEYKEYNSYLEYYKLNSRTATWQNF